jgi:hypothetical protein
MCLVLKGLSWTLPPAIGLAHRLFGPRAGYTFSSRLHPTSISDSICQTGAEARPPSKSHHEAMDGILDLNQATQRFVGTVIGAEQDTPY